MAAILQPSSSRRTRAANASMVGSFKMGDEIGKGSFATVYRASHQVSRVSASLGVIRLDRSVPITASATLEL